MTIGDITTGAQTVTATGAVTPTAGLDVSGITGDYTVHVMVSALSASSGTPTATIQLEDTVNAFTAVLPVAVKEVQGTIGQEQYFSWRKYELPNLRAGTASAKLRANIMSIGGSTPSLTLHSWIEY